MQIINNSGKIGQQIYIKTNDTPLKLITNNQPSRYNNRLFYFIALWLFIDYIYVMSEKKVNIKLTPKKNKFALEYLKDLNATQSAIRSGYSQKTAYSAGQRLLKDVEVQKRISELQKKQSDKLEITKDMILREHAKIGFSNISDIYLDWMTRKEFSEIPTDVKSAIKKIETKILKKNIGTEKKPEIVDVEFVKIELYDKQSSLDSISKMLGFNEPDKLDLTSKGESIKQPPAIIVQTEEQKTALINLIGNK